MKLHVSMRFTFISKDEIKNGAIQINIIEYNGGKMLIIKCNTKKGIRSVDYPLIRQV